MAGQNTNCVNCETACLDCRDARETKHWKQQLPDQLKQDILYAINNSVDDAIREKLGRWL